MLSALPLNLRGEGGHIMQDVTRALAWYLATWCELEKSAYSVHNKKEKIPLLPGRPSPQLGHMGRGAQPPLEPSWLGALVQFTTCTTAHSIPRLICTPCLAVQSGVIWFGDQGVLLEARLPSG